MEIVTKRLDELVPYENNPRHNENAVRYVAESIRQFGFVIPMVVMADGTIVNGHTRYQAAKRLELKEVPCIIADDLTDEQVKAFRLADNRVKEFSTWDLQKLQEELAGISDIDMTIWELCRIEEPEEKPKKEKKHNEIICPRCGHVFEV